MKFGAMIAPRASDWRLGCEVERLGYDSVWISDSHMLWSDSYAILSLVAENTSTIAVGTGVTNAGTRLAPVTANAIATINALAPGRTFLGIGTGFSSMATMGLPPARIAEFREYVRVVRSLVHGEETECPIGGAMRPVRFLEQDLGFVQVSDPPKIYVAANGPKGQQVAGAYGDGFIAGGEALRERNNRNAEEQRRNIEEGAAAVGRTLPDNFRTIGGAYVCILEPGETLASERVIDEVGALTVVGTLHAWWEMHKATGGHEFVPAACVPVWERYCHHLASLGIADEKMHLRVHKAHATYLLPEEREFVTPELIRAGGAVVGEPDEIIERLRVRESFGLDELSIMPALHGARENLKAFRKLIIDRY